MLRKVYRKLRGAVGTQNVVNREEWLRETLMGLPEGSSILDAGAGELQYKSFCNHLKYVSQDFAQYDGAGNTEGLQTGKWTPDEVDIVSDITSMPVESGSFDAVMCVEVLEHLPEPIEAIKEFSRVLRKDGKLILTAPFSSLTHFAPYYFSNGFSKYWYQTILPKHGFEIMDLDYNGSYFHYLGQELRRLKSVTKEYSRLSPVSNLLLTMSSTILLMLFSKFDKHDRGSKELLCHGIHVLAIKK